MRYTLQYIPIDRIKADETPAPSKRFRNWRRILGDCMHVLAVRKTRRGGRYVIVGGRERYEHLRKHTRRTVVPCLIDESAVVGGTKRLLSRGGAPLKRLAETRVPPASWKIIRTFLKQEPRYRRLPPHLQVKVLWMGVRYRRTTVGAMRTAVDEWCGHGRLLR